MGRGGGGGHRGGRGGFGGPPRGYMGGEDHTNMRVPADRCGIVIGKGWFSFIYLLLCSLPHWLLVSHG